MLERPGHGFYFEAFSRQMVQNYADNKVRFTRGHALMWRNMKRLREIHFERIESVNIGRMTQGAWSNDSPVAL